MFSQHTVRAFLFLTCVYNCQVHAINAETEQLQDTDLRNNPELRKAVIRDFNPHRHDNFVSIFSDWKTLLQLGLSVNKTRDSGALQNKPTLQIIIDGYTISDQCFEDTMGLLETIDSPDELWAFTMLDSFGKVGSGITEGNLKWYGSFDQCLAVNPVLYNNNGTTTYRPFDPQYCLARMPIKLLGKNLGTAMIGTCLPNSCSNTDVYGLMNIGLKLAQANSTSTTKFKVNSATCKDHTIELDSEAIGAIFFFSVLAALILIGTLHDIYIEIRQSCTKDKMTIEPLVETEKTPLVLSETEVVQHNSKPTSIFGKFFLCFSAYTNGKKILSADHAPGSLTAVNGIRFLSMSWVILGHCYSGLRGMAPNAGTFLPKVLDRWTFGVIENALVSVDTFFTLSGLLVSYLFMKEMAKKNGKINWFMFYFHRFWRLTPAYMLCIFLVATLSQYWGDGPLWKEEGIDPHCRKHWWINLLYINNVYKSKEMCLGVSWYLANDMQFYVISPLLLVPLYLHMGVGLFVCLIFMTGTIVTTAIITTKYDLPMSLFAEGEGQGDRTNWNDYYQRPWCRIGPYIVGIVFGYILYKTDRKDFKMNKILVCLGWLVATVLALTILYGTTEHTVVSTEIRSLYNTVHRSLWGACVCWVVFACARGYGGFVDTILSWKPFLPLGRLTYAAYLTHMMLLSTYKLTIRQPYYTTDITAIYYFLASLVITMGMAFVVSLAFESPMMGLEKIVFKRGEKKK